MSFRTRERRSNNALIIRLVAERVRPWQSCTILVESLDELPERVIGLDLLTHDLKLPHPVTPA
jgi:hypothetical protein